MGPDLEHHLVRRLRDDDDHADDGELAAFASVHEMAPGVAPAIRSVRRAVKAVRPDVVHGHSSFGGAFARLAATSPQRVLPVEWGQAGGGYEVDVQVTALDRKWLLKDITTLIAQEEANVLDINSQGNRASGRVHLRLRLKVADFGQLSTLLGKLDALPGVEDARRSG